ncbi:hypothetical protein [Methylomonas sp. AM2-LC]|uniref:hypothetical protein n=1 Tax=Methylomonas sp. AM2-LC TaxID=3153301 RepID=UPI003263B5BB
MLKPFKDRSRSASKPTKLSQIIQREDGSEVKIVAQLCFGLGLARSIDVYVHRRNSHQDNWILCSDRPHPNWRSMSVNDYINHGRSQMLQAVSAGEILKVTSALTSCNTL